MLLDERLPVGWAEGITRPIRVASIFDCPLGQLFGAYRIGLDALNLAEDEAAALGFRAERLPEGSPKSAYDDYYAQADRYWKLEVEKRSARA